MRENYFAMRMFNKMVSLLEDQKILPSEKDY